jgi:CheY-like chemotaxis protein
MKKVLLVEDDPFIRDLTSIKLTEQSYAVSVASDGESVLESVHKDVPDVILLDLDLPGMTGLEVLRRLKGDPDLKDIPVNIFSNNDDEQTKKEATQLGTAGFFVKVSTAFEDLLAHIKEVTQQ